MPKCGIAGRPIFVDPVRKEVSKTVEEVLTTTHKAIGGFLPHLSCPDY